MFFKKLIMFIYENITTDWTVYIFNMFIVRIQKNLHGYGYKV